MLFHGPYQEAKPAPVPAPLAQPQFPPQPPPPPPEPPKPLPVTPDSLDQSPLDDEASRRRHAWLSEPFRCKAISTTRLRKCRFEQHAGGHRLKFPVADAICEHVEFDAHGDPAKLLDCRGGWLRIPRDNLLTRAKNQDVWSGSHRGWRWKDGSRYCCPGLWLEPPKSLARAESRR